MFDTKDILKMAKHVFRRGQGIADKRLIHPQRDWGIGLALFLLVVAGGGYICFELFARYQNIQTEDASEVVAVPVYNASRIEYVLTQYEEKGNAFMNFMLRGSATTVEEAASSTETFEDDEPIEENADNAQEVNLDAS